MSAAEELAKALAKGIGENDEKSEVTEWLNTGFPNLNKALSGKHNGGLGFGRLYEMYGPSSSGKTAIATYLMIEAQRRGGVAIFIDYERSFDLGMAMNMGLSDQSPFWIYKQPETWEQGNTQATRAAQIIRQSGAIADDAPIFIVQDSIASATPKSMLYDSKGKKKEMDELTMNDTTALSRVTSTTLKVVAQLANELNATVLYLNQVRTKIGVLHGDPTTTPGGGAMEFYASGRIALGRTKVMETVDGEKEMTAQLIRAKVVKSKHTRPFKVAELRMGFNEDGSAFFDEIIVLLDYLVKLDILETAGAYTLWEGKKYYRKSLAKKIADEGLIEELRALVPADKESLEKAA